MLLAAQHVRQRGEEGVNVSAYVHGPHLSNVVREKPDLALNGDARGRLAFTLHEVKRGGAFVISFFDVAFPDDAPVVEVAKFVERFALQANVHEGSAVRTEDGIGARFFAQPGTDPVWELRALKTALLPIVGHLSAPATSVRPPQPVRVFQTQGPRGFTFALDPNDRKTLETILERALPNSFGIANDTFADFVAFAGFDFNEMVMVALCSVSVDQLDAFGGAEIIDAESGTVRWKSPRR